MGVSQLGKCYASAMDMTNPMPKKEYKSIDAEMDELEDSDEEEEEEETAVADHASNATNTSLIMKFGTRDRQDDFESRD
jgi:RNA polymerase-binding transcription factor DksA